TLTAINSFQSTLKEALIIEHQVEQIANQAKALAQGDLNLTASTLNLLPELHSAIGQYTDTLSKAEGLAFTATNIVAQFKALYPTFGGKALSVGALAAQSQQWLQQIRAASQTAMQAQAALERFTDHQLRVTNALAASQRAAGNLEVTQASN